MRPRILPIALLAVLTAAVPALRAADTHTKEAAPRQIAMGQRVSLADYLVPGKTTVFEFYSPHCPDCMAIAPHMARLHATRSDLAVVQVNIDRPGAKRIDWQSPVAREYHIEETPYMIVYGPNGKVRAAGDKAYALVTGWCR